MSERDTEQRPVSVGTVPTDPGLPFTPERRAFLRPRLDQLLADLRLLEAVVDPSLEPAFTPRDGYGEDHNAH